MKLSFYFSFSILAVSLGLVAATVPSDSPPQHHIVARGPLRHHARLLEARNQDGTMKKMYKRKSCKAKTSSSSSSAKSNKSAGSNSTSTSAAATATQNAKNAAAQESSSSSKKKSTKTSSSSSAAAKSTSSSSSSSGSSSDSGIVAAVKDLVDIVRNGDGTFFTPDTGACGNVNTSEDYIVAISHTLYDQYTKNGNSNDNSLCGRQIKASYQGKSVLATIQDRCEGCSEWDLDFTSSAFKKLADESVGRMSITWEFTGK